MKSANFSFPSFKILSVFVVFSSTLFAATYTLTTTEDETIKNLLVGLIPSAFIPATILLGNVIDDEIKVEVNLAATANMAKIASKLEQLEKDLNNLEIPGNEVKKIKDEIEELKSSNQYFLREFFSSQQAAEWLGRKNLGVELVMIQLAYKAANATFEECSLLPSSKDEFRQNISRCLIWLRDSLKNDLPMPIDKSKITSAIPNNLSAYSFALTSIKDRGIPTELSSEATARIKYYIDLLIDQLTN